MTVAEKIKWVILPALLVMGLGFLSFKFPHALDSLLYYHYRGHLLSIIVGVIAWFVWGRIGGAIAIALGAIAIIICLFPNLVPTLFPELNEDSEAEDKQPIQRAATSFAINSGKRYAHQRFQKFQDRRRTRS
jgi:hypothetical protein